jgi:threonine dehydrogenase-like Zn-dependent dehydrogenase
LIDQGILPACGPAVLFRAQPPAHRVDKPVPVTLYTTRGEGAAAVRRALSLAASGRIRGRELVTHHFPLDEIQEAFRVLREREGDPIKIVIVP